MIVDPLQATFPVGSVTGCSKIRAMKFIDEMESVCWRFPEIPCFGPYLRMSFICCWINDRLL